MSKGKVIFNHLISKNPQLRCLRWFAWHKRFNYSHSPAKKTPQCHIDPLDCQPRQWVAEHSC